MKTRSERGTKTCRRGSANNLLLLCGGGAGVLTLLGAMLFSMSDPGDTANAKTLMLYCAAGVSPVVDAVVADYEKEYGVKVQVQPGGSTTLLSQLGAAKMGDLYIAADMNYIRLAREKGLLKESIPIGKVRPVIAVSKGNPKNITSIDDLLRDDVKTVLGSEQAAIGRKTRKLLEASGDWEKLNAHVTETGTFKPTVPAVANLVKLGTIDAAIIWDTTVKMKNYASHLEAVEVPELNEGLSDVVIGVLTSSGEKTPSALKFARYLTAKDKGLQQFAAAGYTVAKGDKWVERPEITFFCGSVNRRAVDAIVEEFKAREGVGVTTVYNGCGILTGQMKTIRDQQAGRGFPDTYMACDRCYLETVKDWFEDDVDISDTEIVIAVPKGNPKNIKSLQDLLKPGMKVAVGQPEQCTIGLLTKQLLESEGLLGQLNKSGNIATQTPSSALLVPTVTTGSVDAALAFNTDTIAESDKVDTIRLNLEAAKAVQPFSIARTSEHKQLARRLYRKVADSRESFESAGFNWRLDVPPSVLPTEQ